MRALCLALIAACTRTAAPPARPESMPRSPVVVERRECLREPPPDPQPVTFAPCGVGEWVACLDRPSSIALVKYLSDLRRYASDAWIACGPEVPSPKEKPP